MSNNEERKRNATSNPNYYSSTSNKENQQQQQPFSTTNTGSVSNVRQPPVPYSYSIVRGFDNIFDQFKRSFDELLGPIVPYASQWPGLSESIFRQPMVDIVDQGDFYLVTAELPGFTKDQIDVRVNKDLVEIRAQAQQQQDEDQKNFVRHERSYRTFQRTIPLPEEVNPTNVDARLNNGILEIQIPKKEPKPEERMTKVNIK
jgi:HSP20 family protein